MRKCRVNAEIFEALAKCHVVDLYWYTQRLSRFLRPTLSTVYWLKCNAFDIFGAHVDCN